MDRRNFLNSLIGGAAATAAVRAWPFRVFSFPSEPILLRDFITRWDVLRAQQRAEASRPVLLVDREIIPAEIVYRYFVDRELEALRLIDPINGIGLIKVPIARYPS